MANIIAHSGYEVDVVAMIQRNKYSGFQRKIRRVMKLKYIKYLVWLGYVEEFEILGAVSWVSRNYSRKDRKS